LLSRGIGMRKIVQFFKDSYAELRRVVWPSRETVASSTKVVIVSVVAFAIVLGIVDFLLLRGIDLIF
jgi:preprotein translocase subunit SecE